MERLSLTMPATASGQQRLPAIAASACCAVAGAVLSLVWMAAWPLLLSIAATLTCVWLVHRQPLKEDVEYFSADEDGLRYVDLRYRSELRYKWTEVLSVNVTEDGLTVQTGRGALKGPAVFLHMPSPVHSQAAVAAAENWLAAYRV